MALQTAFVIDTPLAPPPWALLERELIRFQTRAFENFFDRYFDERGYLECVPRWGALDGPDDAIGNLANWPVLYLLGGGDRVLEMCKHAQDGHIKQYTEAKTVEVEFARDGMYYKEFPVHNDWAHQAEALAVFNLLGHCDPSDCKHLERVKRFAGFYMDEDRQARNYDPEHKIIRSMLNGSRGPVLRKTTPIDWAGDPIEDDRFYLLHGQRDYAEMLARFETWVDVAGDHPLNLTATGLAFNAYALTGEQKYRNWVIEYVDAWVDRIYANGGIIPSNIGLDGNIGGECGDRWWGGVYGWDHSYEAPRFGEMDEFTLNTVAHALDGFGNALLLTGDQRYVDVWRTVLESINRHKKVIDGVEMYPHMHGDDGWYAYTPEPFDRGAMEVYDWSGKSEDRKDFARGHARIYAGRNPHPGVGSTHREWLEFLDGDNPGFPVAALQRDFSAVRDQVEKERNDFSTPDTRLSDLTNPFNPARTEALVNLMTGSPKPVDARPLHWRLWYFDPDRARPGPPEDVAALVDQVGQETIGVQLVNINPVEERSVIVQGGAYAEHQFFQVEANDKNQVVDGNFFTVRLAPGAGARLNISQQRYVNQPTSRFPWKR